MESFPQKSFCSIFYEIKCSAFWDDEPITKLGCAQYWRFVGEIVAGKNSQFRDNKKCVIAPLMRTHLKSIFGFWWEEQQLYQEAIFADFSVSFAQQSPSWFIMEMIGPHCMYNYDFTTLVGLTARHHWLASQASRAWVVLWKLWFIIFSADD